MTEKNFDDVRPDVWVGHLVLAVPDVEAARQFFVALGMRDLEEEDVAILELRGGTHLILLPDGVPGDGERVPFDLMVDDLERTHREYTEAGLNPSVLTSTPFHDSFTVPAPSGHVVYVNSTHVSGKPV